MKMTTAIFDLDGTLLNSLGDLCDSVTYAVEKHGFPPVSMEQTRIRIGNGVRKLVERSIPEESRTDEMIDICLADFRAFYGEHMMNRTHPYEGIVSVLETLKENGVTVGVLSNKYDSAAKALIEHYFGDLVYITYGERPNIPRKPDPTSVLQLLDELGGDKETTLYIGDSATDMQTAVNAGLTAIGVAWGFRSAEELRASGADALAYEPSDLLPLFEYGVPDVSKAEKALTGCGFGFHYFATKTRRFPT
ncbi:MAG: HAD family hydrolase [Butyricicoccus sp.]